MLKKLYLALSLLLAAAFPALAQSSTGGSIGSFTSTSPGLPCSTSGGTMGGVTCGLTQPNQYKISGSSYTAVSGDAGLLTGIGNASAFTLTIPQAGTTGFGAGAGFGYINVGTANVSVSTTTSLFEGGGGGITLTLIPGATLWVNSDGTNWLTQLSGDVPLSYSAQYIAGQNPNNAVLVAELPQPILITKMVGRPSAATGATATASFFAAPSATACASGTALTGTTNFNANGTAATDQVLSGTTTNIPAGDSLCLQTTGTWTSGAGAITVYAVPGPTPGGGGGSAPVVVNNTFSSVSPCNTNSTTCSVTVPAFGAGHSALVTATYEAGGSPTVVITDNNSDSCSAVTGTDPGNTSEYRTALYYCSSITTGTNSFTGTWSISQNTVNINVTEISGALSGAATEVGGSGENSGTGVSLTCATSGATTVANDLLYVIFYNGASVTIPSPWVPIIATFNSYQDGAALTTYSATVTGATEPSCSIVAIKP